MDCSNSGEKRLQRPIFDFIRPLSYAQAAASRTPTHLSPKSRKHDLFEIHADQREVLFVTFALPRSPNPRIPSS